MSQSDASFEQNNVGHSNLFFHDLVILYLKLYIS